MNIPLETLSIKKHIPNFITLLNLLSGCAAIVYAFDGDLVMAAYLIFVAAIFDFIDGFAARLLHVKSPIGKELDSLADVVSFGLVPGVILFSLLRFSLSSSMISSHFVFFVPFIAFLVPLFSALRLAKFNIDERQTEKFIGLPTPANAIFIASFPLIIFKEPVMLAVDHSFFSALLTNTYFLVSVVIGLSYLLVAEIPLMSLKFQSFGWKENKSRYIFLILSIILIGILFYTAIPLVILLYIVISFFK